jgi:hypothetical protein
MSKRKIVLAPEEELTQSTTQIPSQEPLQNEDIWIEHVFPFLYKEPGITQLWLMLCLVSRQWLRLIGKIKHHMLSVYDYGKAMIVQIPLLIERFSGVVDLKVGTRFAPYLGLLKYLRSLKLVCISDSCPKEVNICRLVQLTSLKIGIDVKPIGLENLTNLTHLSIPYLCNTNISCVEGETLHKFINLKSLRIGVDCGEYTSCVELSKLVPKTVEYLECDDLSVYSATSFTGRGKCHDDFTSYEGGWFEGRRHGEGSWWYKNCVYSGIWKEDLLTSGGVTYRDGFYYEGELVGPNAHGRGKLYSHKGEGRIIIYEGLWDNNVPMGP